MVKDKRGGDDLGGEGHGEGGMDHGGQEGQALGEVGLEGWLEEDDASDG